MAVPWATVGTKNGRLLRPIWHQTSSRGRWMRGGDVCVRVGPVWWRACRGRQDRGRARGRPKAPAARRTVLRPPESNMRHERFESLNLGGGRYRVKIYRALPAALAGPQVHPALPRAPPYRQSHAALANGGNAELQRRSDVSHEGKGQKSRLLAAPLPLHALLLSGAENRRTTCTSFFSTAAARAPLISPGEVIQRRRRALRDCATRLRSLSL